MEASATLAPSSSSEPSVQLLDEVRKGKADWREYRAFRLENGVTCMAVTDRESKTTAMSCAVAVGAAADPRSMSGLAHFCEHMCFLGSEQYPGENEYKRYLSSHGGRSNASTSLHLTTYKFDVLADHAEKAVDIFTNFFVAPLFTESGTSREVNAVDSENSKNLTADVRRSLQILKAVGDQNHYYTKFTTGNKITLPAGDNDVANGSDAQTKLVREALLAFHRYHYRPENMTVTIVGPQSLDTLQDWVAPRFGAITSKVWPSSSSMTAVEQSIAEAAKDAPNFVHGQPVPSFASAFRPELQNNHWPVLLTSKPLRSMRKLSLLFPLPPVRHLKDRNPIDMISFLLGHEGPGSSFALLQKAGYITSLSSGCRIYAPDQTLFQIDLRLTELGESEWHHVASVIFAHCRLIQKACQGRNDARQTLRRIWEESIQLSKIGFDQSPPGAAYDLAPSLAQSIVANGVAACQSAGCLLDETGDTLPMDLIRDFAEQLTPENCLLERSSPTAWEQAETASDPVVNASYDNDSSIFGRQTERWYAIDYYLRPILKDTVKSWSNGKLNKSLVDLSDLALPRPNAYIPESLELSPELPAEAKAGPRIDKKMDPPTLLSKDGTCRLWHRLDDRYALPKSSLTFLIRNPSVNYVRGQDANGIWKRNVTASILSSTLMDVFSQGMAQETYDAELAGLGWSLSKTASGISLSCNGYSDRLPDLAIFLLKKFLLLREDETFLQDRYFVATKDKKVRTLRTYFQSRRADSHAMYYRDLLLTHDSEVARQLEAAEDLTLEAVIAQHQRIMQEKEIEVDCLFTGNVSSKEAKSFFDEAVSMVRSVQDSPQRSNSSKSESKNGFIPGHIELRVPAGQEYNLHFQSENPAEENGAVLITFQSQIPSFRGIGLSSFESLQSSAAIRLICHLLREPLFDTLRTKQQLGYIVSSYYDLAFGAVPDSELYPGPTSTPIDMIVVNILSRKVSPPEVLERVDEFLEDFRGRLATMPQSEITDHADALYTKMMKPIQRLGSEASRNVAKITRYAPEIIRKGGSDSDIPWDSVETLAEALQQVSRSDLLSTWDQMIARKSDRSRIVSCVYGSTFPMKDSEELLRGTGNKVVVKNSIADLLNHRQELKHYDNVNRLGRRNSFLTQRLVGSYATSSSTKLAIMGMAGAAVLGAGAYFTRSLWMTATGTMSTTDKK